MKKLDLTKILKDVPRGTTLYSPAFGEVEFSCIDENDKHYPIEVYEYVDDMGNVIDTKKIIIRKKKPKYPTTFEECCKVLKCDPWFDMNTCYHGPELCALYKLLMCRDAYWKIVGWEPDWKNAAQTKYCITVSKNIIRLNYTQVKNRILVFPTEEMRDAFYENFKELIELCKELL